jgi:hypothetical protein
MFASLISLNSGRRASFDAAHDGRGASINARGQRLVTGDRPIEVGQANDLNHISSHPKCAPQATGSNPDLPSITQSIAQSIRLPLQPVKPSFANDCGFLSDALSMPSDRHDPNAPKEQ